MPTTTIDMVKHAKTDTTRTPAARPNTPTTTVNPNLKIIRRATGTRQHLNPKPRLFED